jgi:hypothetical protein
MTKVIAQREEQLEIPVITKIVPPSTKTISPSEPTIDEIICSITCEWKNKMSLIMDNWCKIYEESDSATLRTARGNDTEKFVIDLINTIGKLQNRNLRAVKGSTDKKKLTINVKEKKIEKEHQVDVHVYLDEQFIAVIECKAYLESCSYVRACDDFKLFQKFGYNVKKFVFALENGINEEHRLFTDFVNDNICDEIFYILDGKRNSSKPVYNKKYKKEVNNEKMFRFVKEIASL